MKTILAIALAVLCLAPTEGQGISDPEKRARIGEDKITRFKRGV